MNEVDVLINDYEKSTNQYLRLSNKLKAGDVSVTLRYMDLAKQLREWPVKHQEVYAKMAPQQTQRVASISARAAPYLDK
ncbi:MAG: hypothetical protein H0X34_13700 [Chthoniobacterales bacterium]|jgi:hypothetical protein|nr:hypothetical protein [Chthoniobacterales bacterium]